MAALLVCVSDPAQAQFPKPGDLRIPGRSARIPEPVKEVLRLIPPVPDAPPIGPVEIELPGLPGMPSLRGSVRLSPETVGPAEEVRVQLDVKVPAGGAPAHLEYAYRVDFSDGTSRGCEWSHDPACRFRVPPGIKPRDYQGTAGYRLRESKEARQVSFALAVHGPEHDAARADADRGAPKEPRTLVERKPRAFFVALISAAALGGLGLHLRHRTRLARKPPRPFQTRWKHGAAAARVDGASPELPPAWSVSMRSDPTQRTVRLEHMAEKAE